MPPLQILIADSRELVRRWVRDAVDLQANWAVCGEATTGPETVAKTIALRPDVVLLDRGLPGGGNIAREISRIAPSAHVLTLTSFTSDLARQQHDERRGGGVLRTESGHTLVDAIQTVIGQAPIAADWRGSVTEPPSQAHEIASRVERAGADLTSRERDVLRHLADGRSNKEIAAILSISARTVETHRARLMRKLNLHSMNQLVRYAIRQRIIKA